VGFPLRVAVLPFNVMVICSCQFSAGAGAAAPIAIPNIKVVSIPFPPFVANAELQRTPHGVLPRFDAASRQDVAR
jgi:hypothetical protein